jgi:hypothetical protein
MKTFKILLASAFMFLISFTSCEKDPCKDVVCQNNSICSEGVCNCLTGYSGTLCQIVDPCLNITCQNGGTCNNGACNCPDGYTGANCQIVVDLCLNVTCQNGGTCNNGNCICTFEYEGTNCQTHSRDKFIGSYNGYENCSSGSASYNIFINTGSSISQIIISNIYGSGVNTIAILTANNSINIPQQTFASGQISGSGTLSNNALSVTFTITVGSSSDNCSATFVKM